MKRAQVFLLVFMALTFASMITLNASQTKFRMEFDVSDIVFDHVDGYDKISMKDAVHLGKPGQPDLPSKTIMVAIPVDVEVERVEIIAQTGMDVSGQFKIYPIQHPVPYMSGITQDFTQPDTEIYGLNSEWPCQSVEVLRHSFIAGQHIVSLAIHSLQYVPSNGRLKFNSEIEFNLIFSPTSKQPAQVNYRTAKAANVYSEFAKKLVINPEDVSINEIGNLSGRDPVDYLIITAEDFVLGFEPLVVYKRSKGFSVEVVTLESIYSTYPGIDNQEKIRNCIIDYNSNNSTQWVLLGGDTDILPHRIAYNNALSTDQIEHEHYIPCDLYYSALEGNWNADDDDVYGENEDNVDYGPEIYLGRAPVKSISEVDVFVQKTIEYETRIAGSYLENALLCTSLWKLADESSVISSSYLEPEGFTVIKYYDSTGYIDFNYENFKSSLEECQNMVNYMGHGNFNEIYFHYDYSEVWTNADMDQLRNGPQYSIFYVAACLTAAIDDDCIGEHFILNPLGGGVVYIGNSRSVGDEMIYYNQEFYNQVFSNEHAKVGEAFALIKSSLYNIRDPYCLTLLGDPTLEIRTYEPDPLYPRVVYYDHQCNENYVTHNDVVSLEVTVKNESYIPSSASTVTISTDHLLVDMNVGVANISSIEPHAIKLVDGFEIQISPSRMGPFTALFELVVDDGESTWTSSFAHTFNSPVVYHDHQFDEANVTPGEIVPLDVTVRNESSSPTSPLTVTISTDDPLVDIEQGNGFISSEIQPLQTAMVDGFEVKISDTWTGTNAVQFDLEVSNGINTWISSFDQEFGICGDANMDGSVNISDAVFIMNYVFVPGSPPPDPLEMGDTDCSGSVNVSDAVFIINYVFTQDKAPCDTDGDGIPDC
jgi:Peptidase family C25/Propeptide_C25/Dockerin type I domain